MTDFRGVRETLVPLLDRSLKVECVTDARTGAWVVMTGYLKGMSGASTDSGSITLLTFESVREGEKISLPLAGIISVYGDRQDLIWKKPEEPTAAEECDCFVEERDIFADDEDDSPSMLYVFTQY